MSMTRTVVIVSALLGMAGLAEAAGREGDPAAGEKIATRGVGNTVVACNFCHGNGGHGAEIKGIPYLAGLGSYYIHKQIDDYRSGARARHPVMEEVAKELTPQQVADVVAYFATFELDLSPAPESTDADLVERGEQLAEMGDPERRVQACSNCHGPRGSGALPAIPPLAGQSARYITAQLRAWQQGDRSNDGGGQMGSVAARLDDASIAAVAAYYAQARPEQRAK
jgi:cytochrome c553